MPSRREAASAAGAAAAGALYVLSTQATMSVEEVALAAPEAVRWFQVYVVRDRGWTADLVARAAAAGYRALVLTVDVPLLGNRLRDLRNDFKLPTGLKPANAPPAGAARQRELAADVLAQAGQFDPGLTPDTIGWLAERSGLPVLVKGVLRGDDAAACLDAGAAGVVVSNHGGRQLDTVVATADALAEVVAAVGDRGEVYVDGGIRRGTDVLKALALGARGVLVGRPVLWGLAVGGAAGVERVLSGLVGELRLAMALCGAVGVDDLPGPDRRVRRVADHGVATPHPLRWSAFGPHALARHDGSGPMHSPGTMLSPRTRTRRTATRRYGGPNREGNPTAGRQRRIVHSPPHPERTPDRPQPRALRVTVPVPRCTATPSLATTSGAPPPAAWLSYPWVRLSPVIGV